MERGRSVLLTTVARMDMRLVSQKNISYCRKLRTLMEKGYGLELADEIYSSLWLFDKRFTNEHVSRDGNLYTSVLELETSRQNAARYVLMLKCYDVETFAVPLAMRETYYGEVSNAWCA